MSEDKWISVDKKLPEPGKIVLVNQVYSWLKYEEGAMVTIGRIRPGNNPYWEFQHYRPDFRDNGGIFDNGIICPGNEYVTAWQPLPEPYQIKDISKSKKKCCGTCKYCQLESITKGWICINDESGHTADWVEYDSCCEKWKSRE